MFPKVVARKTQLLLAVQLVLAAQTQLLLETWRFLTRPAQLLLETHYIKKFSKKNDKILVKYKKGHVFTRSTKIYKGRPPLYITIKLPDAPKTVAQVH